MTVDVIEIYFKMMLKSAVVALAAGEFFEKICTFATLIWKSEAKLRVEIFLNLIFDTKLRFAPLATLRSAIFKQGLSDQ